MRHLIWMCADAGAGPEVDEEGSAEVVAPLDPPSFLTESSFLERESRSSGGGGAAKEEGVMVMPGFVGERGTGFVLWTSDEDAVPVFGRLTLLWRSLSEGERDLLRFVSASEMPI